METKDQVAPRDALVAFDRAASMARDTGGVAVIVAGWLSPRTRQLLDARGGNYLDLTGNVSLRLDRPAVVVRVQGAERDPEPPSRSPLTLRGR